MSFRTSYTVQRMGRIVLDLFDCKRAARERVAQMGWERRGSNFYYYKKEREGSRVKSVYVGRGEIAHMVAQIQSTSPLLERAARNLKSREVTNPDAVETAIEQASKLIQSITQATLLTAGFHTHHYQWRRKR